LSHGLLCGECFAKIDFIAPPICARLGIPLRRGRPLGGGDRLAASLRPRPGGGALFRHHARAYPKLQMSGSAGGPDDICPLAEPGRRPISSCRCRSIRRGSGGVGSISRPCAQSLSGGLPASRSIASRCGGCGERRARWAFGRAAEAQRGGCLQGRPIRDRPCQGQARGGRRRRDHHRRDRRCLSPGAQAGKGREGGRSGARAVEPAAFVL